MRLFDSSIGDLILTLTVEGKRGGPAMTLPVKRDKPRPPPKKYEEIETRVNVDDYADLNVEDFEA